MYRVDQQSDWRQRASETHRHSEALLAHEAAQLGHLRLKRVSTTDQLAHVFTKSLQPKQPAACIARLLRRSWPDS